GTVNEDFAIESMAGDIFQLGNTSWRILGVNSGIVRVEDAKGQPPGMPFWLGEAPARTAELSRAVSEFRAEVEARLVIENCLTPHPGPLPIEGRVRSPATTLTEWFIAETGIPHQAAQQL